MGWGRGTRADQQRQIALRNEYKRQREEEKQLTWVTYPGTILVVTKGAFGIALDEEPDKVALWVTRKLMGKVQYSDGYEAVFPTKGRRVVNFQMPRWWAKERQLI